MGRFMYWTPAAVTNPWMPRWWKGCDEWHNKAVSIVIPFLGAFHYFYGPFSREGEQHLFSHSADGWEGRDVPGCVICTEVKEM